MNASPAGATAALRPTGATWWRVLVVVLLDWAALGLTIALSPAITADSGWAVLLAAVLLGLLAAALRPVLAVVLARLSWAGVFAGWLLTQALLLYAALSLTPGLDVAGFWPAFWASWLYAALLSVGLWFITAGDRTMVVRHLLRVNRRHSEAAPRVDVPGLVMIQIDGLSAPLAEWAVQAGNLPTLGRWLRSGGHRLTQWHAELPPTTPASQAGLLHGASGQVPAFRWYEKANGRLVVTNRPRDSALVEARLSDGRGLLADGGVSVSNVFSGDAPTSLLTMSTIGARRTRRPPRYVSMYLLDPFGLTHSLVLTVGEIIKELHQARRQRVRRVEPRVRRTASYVLLRGLTNVLLRHLNVSIIAEHLMRGTPAIYCDFVDYDEIAHHAGPARPEALAALSGVDDVLATLEQLTASTPRPYHLIVVSDHGQSQGATFRQRYGFGLDDLVSRLAHVAEPSVVMPRDDEQRGRAHALRADLVGAPAAASGAPAPAPSTAPSTTPSTAPAAPLAGVPAPGAPAPEAPPPGPGPVPPPPIVVAASGNLALIYFARQPGRLTMEEIDRLHPELLPGLASHPGVGWVMVRSQRLGPLVLGPAGRHVLADDRVDGDDPLAPFGPRAADDLRRYDGLPHVPDIVVNSALDPATGEVASFEELIGCHGGMGGWQNRPVLIHPAQLPVETELVGADAVYHQLVGWLAGLGSRTAPPPAPDLPEPDLPESAPPAPDPPESDLPAPAATAVTPTRGQAS
ncbi:MAG TPA: phage holin family protein [Pilimelia sp.]|nr:phage holin family protein [Pilimelia sp.]